MFELHNPRKHAAFAISSVFRVQNDHTDLPSLPHACWTWTDNEGHPNLTQGVPIGLLLLINTSLHTKTK